MHRKAGDVPPPSPIPSAWQLQPEVWKFGGDMGPVYSISVCGKQTHTTASKNTWILRER